MRVAFVCHYDPRNPALWAGSTFHMFRALERQGIDLQVIAPLRDRGRLLFKAAQLACLKLLDRELQRDREPIILEGYARQIERQLRGRDAQLVFSSGSVAISRLRTDLPIVFWTDGTYACVSREYVWAPPPPACGRSLRLGHAQEADALRRCAAAIYTSDWAARSAIEDYGTDPSKVHVIPFGANIDVARTSDQVDRLIDARPRDRCNLLYIGVGWQRKGGDIAVAVARRLNERGLPTRLTMLGSRPPDDFALPDFVTARGYFDKHTEAGRREFDELFGSSHFLILPARAEAFGVVLCEACSFGVPGLAGRVGGIPTIVRDDVNGRLFPRDADPDLYADHVLSLFGDFDRYRALARSAFGEYESRLNWSVSGARVKQLLGQILSR